MTAIDLIAWTKLLGFHQQPEPARREVAAFRYRVLHVAARISHIGRRTRRPAASGSSCVTCCWSPVTGGVRCAAPARPAAPGPIDAAGSHDEELTLLAVPVSR